MLAINNRQTTTVTWSPLPGYSHVCCRAGSAFQSKATLGSAIAFFVFETPKVLMLLTLVVLEVGIVRSFFTL